VNHIVAVLMTVCLPAVPLLPPLLYTCFAIALPLLCPCYALAWFCLGDAADNAARWQPTPEQLQQYTTLTSGTDRLHARCLLSLGLHAAARDARCTHRQTALLPTSKCRQPAFSTSRWLPHTTTLGVGDTPASGSHTCIATPWPLAHLCFSTLHNRHGSKMRITPLFPAFLLLWPLLHCQLPSLLQLPTGQATGVRWWLRMASCIPWQLQALYRCRRAACSRMRSSTALAGCCRYVECGGVEGKRGFWGDGVA
jgi:hypothetical protein